MNTLLVISLVLGLAWSQSSQEAIESVYREGKEYVYRLETQVLSGLPKGSRIYSGIKVEGNVRIQFISPTRVNFRVEDPCKVYKVNDRIDRVDPTREMVPTELFTEITDPDLDTMRAALFKPIQFTYIRGHVSDLVTEDDDPVWSVNIKKGVLSFFEINFNERQSLQSLDSPVTVEHSDLRPKFYRVVEPSVTGECETSYWVKPDITPDGQTLMKIEKVRNYDRCIDKFVYGFDMFNGRDCDYCEPDTKFDPSTAQSSVWYNVIGSPSQFIIMNAYTEGQYNFVPYAEKGGRITAFTNQTITLMDSRAITTQIPEPRSPRIHEKPFEAEKPQSIAIQASHGQGSIQGLEKTEIYKMAVKALMAYEKFSREKVEEEAGEIMVELRRLLRILDKPLLEKLLGEVSSDDMKNARKGLLDILPVIGTFEGVDLIMDRLVKDDKVINWPPSVFMNLALMPLPDVPTIRRLHDFIVNKKFTDPMHRRAALLGLGSLGYKMMMRNATEEKEFQKRLSLINEIKDKSNMKQVHRDLEQKSQKLLEERLSNMAQYDEMRRKIVMLVMDLLKSSEPDDNLLAIKTIGNLGFVEFFPEVKAIIWNKKLPPMIRVQGIYNTRRMDYIPDKVREALLPVFLDFGEPEEVRMSAYLIFMKTNPPRPDLELIVRHLPNEPSYNVGAFVWSHLVALSNRTTTCNCIQSLARNSTLALRYARKFSWGMQFSHYLFYSLYSRNLKAGHSYQNTLLFNSKERLPRGFAMVYNSALLGKSADTFEIGMNAKGLDSYLDRLSQAAGSTSLPDVLAELLKPRKPASARQSEQQIKAKINIQPRSTEAMEGHIYFKLFGQELIYMDINPPRQTEDSSSQSSSPVYSALQSTLKFLGSFRSVLYPLWHQMIVTETGLPLFIKLDILGAWKIESNFRQEDSVVQSRALNSKDMVLDFKPSGLLSVRCEMGVDMWYFRTGAVVKPTIYLNSPLSLTFNIDPDKTKFIIKFKNEKVLNPIKIESAPKTFLRQFPPVAKRYPVYPMYKEIMVVDGVELAPLNYEYGKDWFGRTLSLTGKWPTSRWYDVPIFPMAGKCVLFSEYKPWSPTGWELHLQHVSGSSSKIQDAQEQPSHDSSWWPFSGWFGEQMQHPREPVSSQELGASQESSANSLEAPSQIELTQQDLSIQHLQQKFQAHTTVLKTGEKCGFMLRLVESGPNPIHDVQITSFYQRDDPKLEERYTLEIRRAPIPELETKPWKLITDLRINYPRTAVEPSDLLSDQYQQKVQKQIQVSVQQNERRNDSLLALDTLTLSQAIKQLEKLTQPSAAVSSVNDLVNHLMQNMQGPESAVLKDLIQKQRQLQREVQEIKKQPSDAKMSQEISQKSQDILDKCQNIVQKLNSKLDNTIQGQQQAEEAAICQAAILNMKKIVKDLDKIQHKIHPIQPPHEQISQQRILQGIKEQVKAIRQKQEQHSVSKQSAELNKSPQEVDPEQRSAYRFLIDVERQAIQTSQNIAQNPDLESATAQVEKIIKKAKAAKEGLDQALKQDGKLCKAMRVKALEVALEHKLIAHDLTKHISEQELSIPSIDQQADTKRALKNLQSQVKKLSSEILKRICLAVNLEKESSQTTAMPQVDRDCLKSLQINEVKLLPVTEQINNLKTALCKHPQQSTDSAQIESGIISPEQAVRQIVEAVQQIQENIKPIVAKKENENPENISPILLKALTVLSKQAVIVEKLRQALKQCRIQTSMSGGPSSNILMSGYSGLETQVYSPKFVSIQSSSSEDIKNKVESLEKEALKLVKKINQILSKNTGLSSESPQYMNTISSSNRVPIGSSADSAPAASAQHLLKQVHQVQAKQLQQGSIVQSMIQALDQYEPGRSKLFQQFSDIYQLLSEMANVQKSQEEVQSDLKSVLSNSPVSQTIQTVCSQLKDSLRQQKEKVSALERKLRRLQDPSLQLPVQKAQQLKDQIQRLYQEQKNIDQTINKQASAAVRSQASSAVRSQASSAVGAGSQFQAGAEIEDIECIMTVNYGQEGIAMRQILLKIFGKKTIEQLLWEQRQSRLGEQCRLVQDYLEEKQQANDQLAPSYHKLKNELNMYRHWEIMCAYEKEAVDVNVRHLTWRLHEYLKYRFYPVALFIMPDKSSIPNNFEIVSEFRRNMRSMDLAIKTPYETNRFRNLYVPELCSIFVTPNTDTFSTHVLRKVTHDKLPATCEISGSRIKTLDQHRYELPALSPQCKTILSMDCSEDSKYTVMSQPSQSNANLKDITLLTKNEKIEIVQDRAGPSVMVDGHIMQLDSPQSVRHADGTIVSIKKLDKKVAVSIPKLSLHVSTDGHYTVVKLGHHYISKACGLCGNMDSNPNNDLEGPQKVQHPNGATVSAAYLLPDQQCDAAVIQNKLGVQNIQKQARMIAPVQQSKVIEKTQGYRRKTCFSTLPVKRCPENSSSEGITSRLVSYHCLDSSSQATQDLVKRSHSHILDELRYKTVDFNVYESEPKACITQ